MKKYEFTKDTFTRTWRTFLQAFLGYILINCAVIDFHDDKEVIKSAVICLLVSATAAGIAAVMNLEKPDENPPEEVTDDDV